MQNRTAGREVSTKGSAGPRADLAGASVVITRPVGAGDTLIRAVRARGGTCVSIPGLSLRSVPHDRRTVSRLQGADIWIFSSPAAVQFAFRIAPRLHLRRGATAVAIGEGTARSLARHEIPAIVPAARRDSEGVLDLPQLADVEGRSIALIGAAGGRDLIASTLRARGADVAHIHVYERVEPRLTRRHFDALARAPDPLITLLSSAQALTNLLKRLPAAACARLRTQALVVSSERLAAIAAAQGFETITQAASALPRDLLDAAAAIVAERAR